MRSPVTHLSITRCLAICLLFLFNFTGTHAIAGVDVADANYIVFYHHDALGSPTAVTDHNGNVLWHEHNEPYGQTRDRVLPGGQILPKAEDNSGERLGYTGHELDRGTDLVYMKARFYDPVIGRFYSNDPVGFSAGHPMMFNRYAYANNNPYTYVDPDGKSPDPVTVVTEVLPAAGRAFGAFAALGVGYFTGDRALVDAAMDGLEDNQSESLAALSSLIAPPGTAQLKRVSGIVDGQKNEVFRALRAGENPAEGLRARAPGVDTRIGSHVMGKKQSDLISTTKDQSKAEGIFNSGNGVVAIDLNKVSGQVIDVSRGVGRGRVFSRTKSHQEILIRDSGGSSAPIPVEAIRVIQ